MKKLVLFVSLSSLPVLAQSNAQTASGPNANPLSAANRHMYAMTKSDVLNAAEEMPEENYAFKPVATVRTFGQLVGHVADAQYEFCAAVVGDGKQPPGIEKSKTSKADLIQALKDGFAYCDQAYNNLTDAQAAQLVKFFGHDSPKLTILSFNVAHNMEHYGNMVTYLRIKGLVPPSSQQQPSSSQ
ncbi:MAG: DinB family protein [Acidobacteriaceae bacterium]|nr:DinB family protein [Acidobacteriaceae bacterium]MBV9441938.1 DinB family protein [Acidobacteriaceae bacterium]